MSTVSIVVPVYHNASSLPDLLDRFVKLAAINSLDSFEFLFVDDGSRDNSFQVLLQLCRRDPRVRVVKLSRNFGSNAALLAGLSHARGEVVAAISADLQDPPELIGEMLELWRQGHHVVLAARSGRDDPSLSPVISLIFYRLFRRFAIKSMPEQGFDFFLLDRRVSDLISSIQENNAYLMGLILWVGYEPVVIHYHRQERERHYGRSMWTFTKKIKYFVDCFVAFSYMPIRASSLLGVLLSLCGLVYAAIVVAARLSMGVEVEGWTSLMVVILVVSGVQMLMIGVVGEYIWRNLDEARRRPRFIVDRIVEQASLPRISSGDETSSSRAEA